MYHFQAFALAEWAQCKIIGSVYQSQNEDSTNQDLDQVLQLIAKKQISQFQKIQSLPSQLGRWYYRPFNKDIIEMVLVSNECNQAKVEMLLDTIDGKIFDHDMRTPNQIDNNSKKNIYNLLRYFDTTYSKDVKQMQSILETLNNTKSTVQQNIEKLIHNKEQINTIEIKSLELDDSSKTFLNSATQLKNKNRMARMKQLIIIGIIGTVSVGVISYLVF